MKRRLLALLLACFATSRADDREALRNPVDDPALPRVLLIGDSISLGYTVPVRKALAGVANVHRIPENGRYTGYGLEKMDTWLGTNRWDVIHFNWGLWDVVYWEPGTGKPGKKNLKTGVICTPPEEYAANLEKLVTRLEKTGAKLVWAATTPVPAGEPGRKPGDEITINKLAAEIMRKHNIEVNDLHARAREKLPGIAARPGDVHYTNAGSQWLGAQVVECIRAALPAKVK
jgi:hypothetical protein